MYDYESKPSPQELAQQRKKKQKQTSILIALALLGGIGYFFLGFLPEERTRAKEEIEEVLRENYLATVDKLDKSLWAESESWEEYLDSLYLPSQVKAFKEKIIRAIENKMEELEEEERDRPRKMREDAIDNIKSACKEEELEIPSIQEIIEKFTEKINKVPLKELDNVKKEAKNLIEQERFKRQGLHWRREIHNWADRWLIRNRQSFENAWDKTCKMLGGQEPPSLDINGIYKIDFPPSLWNDLSEEQQTLAQQNGHGKLTLRSEVSTYRFSPLIEEWENKTKPDPARGEQNPNNISDLDNNALFYGAPRTGKSVMAEKLAYEADKYPLVTIQGSSLTPRKPDNEAGVSLLIKFIYTISTITHDLVDNYGFEREEDGEVRYILFLDEADQVCTTYALPPAQASSQLTFLKECMGSDNKSEESKNLWIAATNHLDNVNGAVYQSGRLSNPLDFSWTLGTFLYYARQAGITSRFPHHWTEITTLNAEDNKWVNRFNKIIFDKHFLGKDESGSIDHSKSFWQKFIDNSKTQEKLNEIKETNENGEEIIKQKGVQWGEFFEFFWQLYDSKQLEDFNGEFETPRKPKMEEIVEENLKLAANKISSDIAKAIDTRLNELNDTAKETKDEIQTGQSNMLSSIDGLIDQMTILISELRR